MFEIFSKLTKRRKEELKKIARIEVSGYSKLNPDAPNFNKRKSGGVIPGAYLEIFESNNSPYNIRIRFYSSANGAFDWQADVLTADWQALIAAITGLVGTKNVTYTIPNATYASTIKYAGTVPPNDLTT